MEALFWLFLKLGGTLLLFKLGFMLITRLIRAFKETL